MAIENIRSKIKDNKVEKENKLLETAFKLFMEKGIKKTSVQDIVHNAGIAKGTFYLYFKDKYELEDVLITRTAHELISDAILDARKLNFNKLDDKIVYVIDHIINDFIQKPHYINFIKKNLTLGLYSEKITSFIQNDEYDIKELFIKELNEYNKDILNPDITLFMIFELVSSTAFTSIIEKRPLPIEEFKPYLYNTIRSILNEKPTNI